MAKLPLEGIRIADLTGVWAGTVAMLHLADMGAEVIRVESTQTWQTFTRGSFARPRKEVVARGDIGNMCYVNRDPGPRPWNRWAFHNSHARNKLGMTVDLRKPEGMEVLKRLVKVSDVVAENSQAEVMEKLGITYEMLKEVNPEIIYMRMPGYGTWGPYKEYRAYGANLEDAIGHSSLRGYPDLSPSERTPTVLFSDGAGVAGAFVVLAALYYRKHTGKGIYVEAAQAENVIPCLGQAIMDYTMNERVLDTVGNRHTTAIQGCYPARRALSEVAPGAKPDRADLHQNWVVLTISNDAEWLGLVRAMDNPGWAEGPKFVDQMSRRQHHDEIDEGISAWSSQHHDYEIFHRLQREGVPAGPVLSGWAISNDQHMRARGFFKEIHQEECGTHRYPGWSAQFSETPIRVRYPPVRLGEHNEYVYKELLGYSDEDYKEMERLGHIGMDFAPHIR
ncbi:MAG: CoA transferase [Chloroflexi bacterium]|nr:CoA transferase [Chloroflexota bacterium]